MAQVQHPMSKRSSAGGLLKRKHGPSGEEGVLYDTKCSQIDDSEFPYHSGEVHGIKCCTKCGATKTPQWREGPYGPKTLCNACGVKRTRKLRAEQDGHKRKRTLNSSIVKGGNTKGCNTCVQEHIEPLTTSLKDEGHGMYQLQGQNSINLSEMADLKIPLPNARGRRKSAEEAAYRTARYAKTGEWGNAYSPSSKKSMFKFDAAGNPAPGSSSSDNASAPLSDTPEEIAWAPRSDTGAYTPDYTVRTSDDCFAAINLMTMSAKSSLEDTFFSQPLLPADTPESSPTKIARLQPSNSDVEAALKKAFNLAGNCLSDSQISILSQSIPPGRVAELIKLAEHLSTAQKDAEIAEAGVSAIAAMLAANQASLLQKQYQVSRSMDQIRRFMYDLETKSGLTYKVLPRIRITPAVTPPFNKQRSNSV